MSICTHMRRAARPFAVVHGVLMVCAAPVHADNPRAESVLAALPFSASERKQILAGELVATSSREKTSDRELAITMAFLIRKPPADLVAMFQKATGYNSDKTVRGFGELRADGGLADLQALRLQPNGDAEAKRFADAKPGDDLNLSSEEIAAFRALPDKSKATVEAQLRTMLLARFQAYRANGLAGIAPYDRGGGKTSSPGNELTRFTKASPVLAKEAPEVVTALLDFPKSQPPKSSQSFFWVDFEIDGRPTIALTHRLITQQEDGTYIFVDRHYYVSRSHNAVQSVAGVFPVDEGALVLYANRTFTDQLGGFAAGTKQAIGRKIMSGKLAELYERIRSQSKK